MDESGHRETWIKFFGLLARATKSKDEIASERVNEIRPISS